MVHPFLTEFWKKTLKLCLSSACRFNTAVASKVTTPPGGRGDDALTRLPRLYSLTSLLIDEYLFAADSAWEQDLGKPYRSARRCFGMVHGISSFSFQQHTCLLSLGENLLVGRNEVIFAARKSRNYP
ncbi:unnamed protein product [Cylicocyclus nassatus]|uniref:Uncharacterized protein n=1 Tax=Cylicocyclus nassatus TaxID=53992 RepID=A0AA36DUB6_CYLNA|nr:unnamed protein product [Cylicocyclus nassatus]